MKHITKNLFLFIVFGSIYFLIETLWKGHITHWSMFLLAGAAGLLIGGINEYLPWEMPFILQCGMGMAISTVLEGITGMIVNVWLHLNVWHYNKLAFWCNQCSVYYCLAWFTLSGVCILLDDWLRWKCFGEDKPYYTL